MPAFAAVNDWAEGTQDDADGATRDYYNRGAYLEWQNYLGDWRDASNVAQGLNAYATTYIVDDNSSRFIEWDVTNLVRQWVGGTYQNQGMFIKAVSGGGPVDFRSREYATANQRPQLVLQTSSGNYQLSPEADTYLEPSTYRSMGNAQQLRLRENGSNILLRFDVSSINSNMTINSATLRLFTYAQYNGSQQLAAAVFRCAQGHSLNRVEPLWGISGSYLNDEGIGSDPDVVFFTSFESDSWQSEWSSVGGELQIVSSDAALQFSPHQGKALRAMIPEGGHTAMSLTYKFADKTGSEPEEIYFRYYVRLAESWNQTVFSGKMPGVSGTYGVAGWGGRKSDGYNGWSARGTYGLTIPANNPLGQTTPMGFYCYHADMPSTYGDVWYWTEGYESYLYKNRWYSIEQYVRMNTPGQHNGVLRTWVDGHFVFEKSDIRFRLTDALKIEQIWMNIYHGGTADSPYDQHAYIDNVVVARRYIGPMRTNSNGPKVPNSPHNLRILP
jgi:hypothetical protein